MVIHVHVYSKCTTNSIIKLKIYTIKFNVTKLSCMIQENYLNITLWMINKIGKTFHKCRLRYFHPGGFWVFIKAMINTFSNVQVQIHVLIRGTFDVSIFQKKNWVYTIETASHEYQKYSRSK